MARETFGDLLKNERQERGLGIAGVAETLEVDPAWLRALELNDFAALPDEATMQDCLERYAVCLGVEADLMIADYDLERERYLRDLAEGGAPDGTPAPTPGPEAESKPTPELKSQVPPEPATDRVSEEPRPVPAAPVRADEPRRVPSGGTTALSKPEPTPVPDAAPTRSRSRAALPLALLIAVVLAVLGLRGFLTGDPAPPEIAEALPPATKLGTDEPEPGASEPSGREPSRTDLDSDRTSGEPAATSSDGAGGVTSPSEDGIERIWASPPGVAPADAFPEGEKASGGDAAEAVTDSPPEPSSHLSVSDHGVGTGVQDRVLIGRSDRFPAGSRVWYWTRVVGGSSGDEIRHVWLRDGAEASSVTLRVGAATWRTFSSITLGSAPSDWAVEVRDENGVVLARSEFVSAP